MTDPMTDPMTDITHADETATIDQALILSTAEITANCESAWTDFGRILVAPVSGLRQRVTAEMVLRQSLRSGDPASLLWYATATCNAVARVAATARLHSVTMEALVGLAFANTDRSALPEPGTEVFLRCSTRGAEPGIPLLLSLYKRDADDAAGALEGWAVLVTGLLRASLDAALEVGLSRHDVASALAHCAAVASEEV